MHKKTKELVKARAAKGKKKLSPAEKAMGHSVDSPAHKRMMSKKAGY